MLLEKYRYMSMPPDTVFSRFMLDKDKCSGCARCVKACPIQLLMIKDKKSAPNNRYDHFRCITCQNCVAVCPENAIQIQGDYRVRSGFWKNDDLYSGPKSFPEPFEDSNLKTYDDYEKDLSETEKVILKRRSIRLYRKKQVPKHLIRRIIEAGRFAPSAGNNQPWKFLVIQNRDVIDQINQKCKLSLKIVPYLSLPHAWMDKKIPGDRSAKLKPWQKLLLSMLIRIKPGDLDQRVRGGVNTVTSDPDYDIFFNAPTLIVILADKRAIGGTDLDTGICAQNMVLTAHALGLGTCYVGLIEGLKLFPGFRKKIGVHEPFEIVTSFTLGYPMGKIDKVVAREQARVEWID